MIAPEATTGPGAAPRRGVRLSISGTLGLFSLACLVAGRVANAEPGVLGLLWSCPVKSATGLPCFTCGITRVYMMLARGELVDALLLAPLPFLIATGSLVVGAWHLYARLLGRPLPDQVLGRLVPIKRARVAVAVSFFALWGYAIARSLLTGAP